jgi:glycine/D-amino acid oxidase-like deaminating enzyme
MKDNAPVSTTLCEEDDVLSKLDRRSFLELTGKNLGALGLLPAWSLRAQSEVAEVAVIGAGAFGGWTALYLREMGLSVTLIDAYGPGNARSSSAGETRQIRAAYGERELYSRWAIEALERWKQRQAEWGKQLLFETGQITFGSDWVAMRTTKAVLDRLGVTNEILSPEELARHYPQFDHGGAEYGVYTPSTGVLLCREACLAVADAFERQGGRFIMAKAIPGRRAGGRLQEVTLSNGRSVSAQSFVFACGPWHPKMFPELLGNKLRLNRRTLFFMGTPDDDERLSYPRCPTFTIRGVYGFPNIHGKGLKIGPYWDSGSLDPDIGDRTVTAEEIRKAHEFVDSAFPSLAGQPLLETRVSPRTDSVDGHFIVDQHPELDNVWIVGGGSGHGFKHGPMMGEHVAQRVAGKSTSSELVETFRLKDAEF